jgi:superfamily II helicase
MAEDKLDSNTKICSKCKLPLPLNSFSRKSKVKDGLQYYCKDCVRQSVKRTYDKQHLKV